MEAIPHNLCPHTTSRSEFGNLFKQIIVAVEKERAEEVVSLALDAAAVRLFSSSTKRWLAKQALWVD